MMPFQQFQLAVTEYLREMQNKDTTREQKPRQQEIYRDLVYKNINQCIADVFPITKNIIPEDDWETMIREFINVHSLQTPYFLEICQEFLAYFINTRTTQPTDHPFIVELAHFEWIQLAIEIADIEIADINFPDTTNNSAPTDNSLWKTSPLALGLSYSYPVHIIDEFYLPTEPSAQATYLVVYRSRNDDVKIMEIDNLSLAIIQLLQTHENINYSQILQSLLEEVDNNQKEILQPRVLSILNMLAEKEVVFYH